MTLSICPAAEIHAPLDRVWGLLSDPSRYSSWADARTIRIDPEGMAHAGQIVHLQSPSFGVKWNITLRILALDEHNHRIVLETDLPFGMVLKNAIMCTALDDRTCFVRYG